MATTFVPAQFVRLHGLIQRSVANPIGSPGSSSAGGSTNDWYVIVDGLRNELVDLNKVKGADESERKEIEGGKITLGGTTHSLNSDFASLTLLLASSLNASPRYCASLLQAALYSRSRYPSRSPIEVAFILYHRERSALTQVWKEVISAAVTLPQEDNIERRKLGLRFSQALQALLGLRTGDGKGKKPLSVPQRLLAEIDSLKNQASDVENALRNPPAQPAQRLPDELQLDRLAAIRSERRAWGHVLHLLCISGLLQGEEIVATAQWLSKVKETDTMGGTEDLLPYILVALLGGLETAAKVSLEGEQDSGLPDLLEDRQSLNTLNSLINATPWATPSVQAIVQIQWALLLIAVVKHEPSLGEELRITEDSVNQAVLKAIQKHDAFSYMVFRLLGWRQQLLDALEGIEEDEGATATASAISTHFETEGQLSIDIEFQQYLLSGLHGLLLGFSQNFLGILRKIQRQEEDAAYGNPRQSNAGPLRRYDLEAFFDAISLVARGDSLRCLDYWLGPDSRRTRFLLWATEIHEEGHQRALLDLLSALASGGGDSAWQAHSLLSNTQDESSNGGLVGWNRLWDWMAYYVEALRTAPQSARERATVPPGEAALLRSFLRLLKTVVGGSFAAREALLAISLSNTTAVVPAATQNPFGLSNQSVQSSAGVTVLQRLFAMYISPVSIELKAAILDALAAFVREPPSGSLHSASLTKIRQDLWGLLESSNILTPNKTKSANSLAASLSVYGAVRANQQGQQSGVRHELEQVEIPIGIFPGTTSFINLIAALVSSESSGAGSSQSSGQLEALVADLPSTSVVTGQKASASRPLGVPFATGSGAGSPTDVGLEKYLSFVIESVLLPSVSATSPREFAQFSERWRVVSTCLHFLEKCLADFDLSALLRPTSSDGRRGAEDRSTLLRLAMHPGFGVMKRLTGSSKLLHEVLAVLSPNLNGAHHGLASNAAGFEIVESQAGRRAVFLPGAVRAAMRIVLKALRLQDLFIQVLLPSLASLVEPEALSRGFGSTVGSDLPAGFDLEARIGQSGSYSSIDAKLLQEYESVVQMALFVNSSRNDLALLGVTLLGEIASSQAFSEIDRFADGSGASSRRRLNRLVGLLEMTDESVRVREGVVRRLDALAEGDDAEGIIARDVSESIFDVEATDVLEGTTSSHFGGNETICRSILNILLANTAPSQPVPNIAHLLLGFDLRATRSEDQNIPIPSSDNPRGALHALLDLLRSDRDPTADDEDNAVAPGLPTLLQTHPALADKALTLLVRLSTHPVTSSATLRYLRTQEDFWGRQLRANLDAYILPVIRSDFTADDAGSEIARLARGSVVFADGQSINTSIDALLASLNSRRQLLLGTALELHGLVTSGMLPQAARLAGALLGSGLVNVKSSRGMNEEDDSLDELVAAEDLGDGMHLLEILQSFDFEWQDERGALVSQLVMLRDLDVSQAKAADASVATSREYDITKTIALLAFARRELERQGELGDQRRRSAFDKEAAIVLQYASARNAHRVLETARKTALQAWRNVHDLVFSHSSLLVRPEARSTVVFDCLGALLPRLEDSSSEDDPVLADLAAGAILTLLTNLRRHRTALGAAAELSEGSELMDDLPVDRLLVTLRALTSAILRSGTSISARGNLYSAFINYLQLAKPVGGSIANTDGGDDAASVAGDTDDGASAIFSTAASASADQQPLSLLGSRTRSYLATQCERLIPVIARDALDAPDVWRTVAFTLLDKLSSLEVHGKPAGHSSRSALIIDILSRGGFIKSFIARLRDMDVALQQVLRPDPPSLNTLYVYESMLAFFGRLAQSREGSERLLEGKLFDVFAQVDFLAARPDQDQDFVDLEGFLPAATERYAAMLLPALRVSFSVVSTAVASTRSRALVVGVFSGSRAESHPSHAALQQALALLNAHRDAFLAVIKAAVDEVTSLAAIEEATLIVSLLLQIVPILDNEALSPPKALSSFHTAVLSLSAGFLHSTAWKARVVPFNESEREDDAIAAPSYEVVNGSTDSGTNGYNSQESQSLFDVSAQQAVNRLNAALLAYLEGTSDTSGGQTSGGFLVIRPAFTASLAVPQPFVAGSRGASRGPLDGQGDFSASRRSVAPSTMTRLASVPTLGTALAALDEQVGLLEADLQSFEGIQSMIENSENVRLEEWDKIASQALAACSTNLSMGLGGAYAIEDLSLGQRRGLATRELKSTIHKIRSRSTSRLDAIDLLLVLIHRHFSFYLGIASGSLSNSGLNANAGRGGSMAADLTRPWSVTSGTGKSSTSTGSGFGGLDAWCSASLSSLDGAALLNQGSQVVQMILERLGRLLLVLMSLSNSSPSSSSSTTINSEAAISSGLAARNTNGNANGGPAALGSLAPKLKERCAFIEILGRRVQELVVLRAQGLAQQQQQEQPQ